MDKKYKLPPDLIIAYDNLFINNTDRLPLSFFSPKFPQQSHNRAIELIRYAVESRLHWNKYELRDYLTMDVIVKLKLRAVLRYVIFPEGFNESTSLFYIAWCLYPETKNKTIADVELETYDYMLSGRIPKLPKLYFNGIEGLNRAYHCLIHVINRYDPCDSKDLFYLYEKFSSSNAISFLNKFKLTKVCNAYNITPLEFFHIALPVNQRSNLYYSYFSFMLKYCSYKARKSISEEEID